MKYLFYNKIALTKILKSKEIISIIDGAIWIGNSLGARL